MANVIFKTSLELKLKLQSSFHCLYKELPVTHFLVSYFTTTQSAIQPLYIYSSNCSHSHELTKLLILLCISCPTIQKSPHTFLLLSIYTYIIHFSFIFPYLSTLHPTFHLCICPHINEFFHPSSVLFILYPSINQVPIYISIVRTFY